MKRILSLILALLMLAPIIACSSGEENPDNKQPTEQTTKTPETTQPMIEYEKDDLPDNLDFGGQTINILCNGYTNPTLPDMSAEDLTSDVVNDSIYNREVSVEERLGVEINFFLSKNYQEARDDIELQINSGENTYHAYALDGIALSRVAIKNYLTDLYTVDHLNFDKPWWSNYFSEESSLLDELYFTTGALSLSLARELYPVYYNKDLTADYAKDFPELEDLYSLVESGKWTWDKFVELGGSIYQDLNGNSKRDEEDMYGIGYLNYVATDAIWGSFDIDVLTKTDDDWFELAPDTDKVFSALDKLYNLYFNTEGCYSEYVEGLGGHGSLERYRKLFANGTLLFMVNRLGDVESNELRNMQNEYGILPYPKYDENQKGYYTGASDCPTAFAIPTTNDDPNTVGAVLEALASYSYRYTRPAYLDTALKGKYMSDPQSRKMVDLVIDGFKIDASWIYFDTLADQYPASYRYMLMEGKTSYSSNHASKEKTISRLLKYTRQDLEK